MSLRRFAPVPFLALALSACNPSVTNTQASSVVTAAFDPTALVPVLPQPNDLVLELSIPSPPPNAEYEFLGYFKSIGGFPYDQELDLTIPFVTVDVGSPGTSVPLIDVASVKPCTAPSTSATSQCNLLVWDATAGTYPALGPITYSAGSTTGTLTVVNGLNPATGNRLWTPGHMYIFAVRTGSNGVKTVGGGQVYPSGTTYALLFSQPNSLPGCGTTPPTAQCLQAQALWYAYQPVFAAVTNTGFPQSEIAVTGTFTIAPANTWVEGDASSGQIPVPSDFLIDPLTGNVNAALDAQIPEISTLDGFSTTAIQLAPTSGPIQALTVRDNTNPSTYLDGGIFLYEYQPASGTYVEVQDFVDFLASPSTTLPSYLAQPPQLSQGTPPLTTAVALQPAVAVPVGPVSPTAPGTYPPGQISLQPLKSSTTYAVVITKRILDAHGNALNNTTLGQMLMFTNPLCEPSPACAAAPATAVSTVPGVPNAESSGLEKMRLGLKPLFPKLAADHGITKSDIAMVYTVTTQSILDVMAQLPALPYQGGGTSIVPGAVTALTPSDAFALFGVDPTVVPGVTTLTIGGTVVNPVLAEVLEAPFPTYNLIDPTTGAFYPSATQAKPLAVQALIAVPNPAAVPDKMTSCPGVPATNPPSPPFCQPLVVFHHGLGGGRGQMLLVANELAAQGFVVAALDAPLHGLRSYCDTSLTVASTGTNPECVTASGGDGTCTAIGPPGTQGDANPPGTCTNGSVLKQAPVLCPSASCQAAWGATAPQQRGGTSVSSGSYLISSNVYRSRDNLRQDVIDVSSLILALARPPAPIPPPATTSPVFTHLLVNEGIVVDPSRVYYEGISLGGILGTLNTAANPRISNSVLNVAGGTIVDIIVNSPAFADEVTKLLPPPGTPAYVQTLLAFKWILDPADPVNLAAYVQENALPSPIGTQPTKHVIGMWAACDGTVPNPENVELYDNIGLGAPPGSPVSTSVVYERNLPPDTSHPACPLSPYTPTGSAVPHGFLGSWGVSATGVVDPTDASLTLTGQQQAAAFLANPTNLPPPVVVKP